MTAVSLLLVLILSSAAFFVPNSYLPILCFISGILVLHGLLLKGNIGVIGRVFIVQLVVTMSLYYLLHGQSKMAQGLIAVLRILLVFIPGWWLSVTTVPEKIAQVLTWVLPVKWAFVIGASISLLPFMTKEIREIYQVQCLRGANITPKALRDPRHWQELMTCVVFPLLIQLLKLSQQMAISAQIRYYGRTKKPTHWQG
ncbi:MAG: energy-coupling factor transporter transmembrane component T [Shewanella sp.]